MAMAVVETWCPGLACGGGCTPVCGSVLAGPRQERRLASTGGQVHHDGGCGRAPGW